MSALLTIPPRLLKGAMLLLALGVIIFFGLTRTEVGREALRVQIEAQFDRRFEGRLTIGQLRGNLAQDVFASNVRLFDAQGRLVLEVDSMAFKPRWRDLLDRSVTSGRLYLYRPKLHLVFDEDGPNIARIFRRTAEALDEATPWSVNVADVRVIDGAVLTTNAGYTDPSIERGIVFDYSRMRAADVNGRALIESDEEDLFVDLRELSLDLAEPGFRVHHLRGQLGVDDALVRMSGIDFAAGGSEGLLSAVIPYGSAQKLRSSEVDFDIRDALLDYDSLRTLIPALPLAGQANVSLSLRGHVDSFVIEEAHIEHGFSSLTLAGTIIGLPEQADFELALDRSRVHPPDLESMLPGLEISLLRRAGMVNGDAYAIGEARFAKGGRIASLHADGRLSLASEHGTIDGSYILGYDAGSGLLMDSRMNLRKVAAHVLVPELNDRRTELNGSIEFRGRGTTIDAVDGSARATLGQSWIAGQLIDSLDLDLTMEDGRIDARGGGRQGAARATGAGYYKAGRFAGDLSVVDLDAGRWWLRGDSVRTRLNGLVSISGVGSSLSDLDATLRAEVDSSMIWHGASPSTIPAHVHEAQIRQSGAEPSLTISGDVVNLRVSSDAPIPDVARAVEVWRPALASLLERERAKQYRLSPDTLLIPVQPPPRANREMDPVRIAVEGQVLDSDILSIIYDNLAGVSTDLALEAELNADAETISLSARIEADSLRAGGLFADSLHSLIRLSATTDSAGVAHPAVHAELAAASMFIAAQNLSNATLSFDLVDGAGTVDVRTSGDDQEEQFLLLASVLNDDVRRQLQVETLLVAAAGSEWSLSGSPSVDLYNDAVVFRGLQVQSMSRRAPDPQRIRLDGSISSDPRDTLFAFIEQVRVGEISEMLRLRHPVEGEMNGYVAITGLARQPEITGFLDMEEARFDGRAVGQLSVRSMYVAGEPDITLEAAIRPNGAPSGTDLGTPLNDLRLRGSVRFPVPGAEGRLVDPGRLNLALDVDHADAFFFDYIFREIKGARGVLRGTGAIRGDFRRPIFEAQLSLRDGGMRIPDFNLAYEVNGQVRVDSSAIRLQQVQVRDATGGRAVVNGDILFNQYRFFSFDLRASLSETQFMNVANSRDMAFFGDVRASGSVALTGPLDNATLSTNDAVIHPDSRVYIAIMEETGAADSGFIVFADSTGEIPDMSRILRRAHVLSQRPAGERMFVDGLEMDLNILAPQGTNIHLVIDPVLGDVINATASGRIQLQRSEGDYSVFGTLDVDAGDYVFTAGDVFVRRFLIDGGTISWDGDPANAEMNIEASYRTRASAAGLNIATSDRTRIPLIVRLDITGRVAAPAVGLRLLVDRDSRDRATAYESLESILNQPERSAEYATSVMLTNSFLLTTSIASTGEAALSTTRNQLAFNSLSQLVAAQLNRYLGHALPNVDVNLGLQGESTQDVDVTYGVALRLLDERLVIRGQGLYQNESYTNTQQNLLDEFVVEVRVSNSVSVEVFYRRENDILASDHTLANTTGAGLSYETQFSSWPRLVQRIIGRRASSDDDDTPQDVIAGSSGEPAADSE